MADIIVTGEDGTKVIIGAATTAAVLVDGALRGDAGAGIASGGSVGQFLKKTGFADYQTGFASIGESDVTNLSTDLAAKASVTALTTETTRATTAEALALQKSSNLSDLASASTARTNLGLGSAALLGDATTGAKGVVQLSGDLGGTAVSPKVKNVEKVFNIEDYGAVGDGYSSGVTYNGSATNNATAIQSAINAAAVSGGTVVVPPHGYMTDQLDLKQGVSLRGTSRGDSVLILKANSTNGNLVVSDGFGTGNAATGTDDSWAGISYLNIDNLTLDGNQGNQSVSSGQSDYRNQFAVLKLYSWHHEIHDVEIRNAKENGFYTEYAANGDLSFIQYQFNESIYENLFIKNFGIAGWVNRGPSDSHIKSVYISSYNAGGTNASVGYVQQGNGNYGAPGMVIDLLHCWGQFSTNCVYVSSSNIIDGFIYAEGSTGSAIYLSGSDGNSFKATVGYCVAGVELTTSSSNNHIEASVRSNVTGPLFRLDGGASANTLIHTLGDSNPSGAIFDLTTGGSYTGSNNTFVSSHPYGATMFAGSPAINDKVDTRSDNYPLGNAVTRFELPVGGTKFKVTDSSGTPLVDAGSMQIKSVADPSSAQDAATKNYVDTSITGGSTPDATTSSKGKIQLSGDLGGTAGSPLVKALARVFNAADAVYGGLAGDDSTDDGPTIRAAQLAAHNAGGGIVYLPRPSVAYKVVAVPVTGVSNFVCGLLSYPNVFIVGEDMMTTSIKFYGSAGRVDGVNIGYTGFGAATIATLTNSGIRNITLDGGGISGSSFGSAVRQNVSVDFAQLGYDQVRVKNWAMLGGIGIGMTGGGNSRDVKVTNIYGDNVLRAVVWFALVDDLYIDNIWGTNIVGDTGTTEGGVVQVESGFAPIIRNITGINTPYQTLLLGGTTRGVVSGVRGTFNLDGIYLTGNDWHISDVRMQVGSSPAATTHGIRYDKTLTPGQPNGSPAERTNTYNAFSDIWIASPTYGLYINASETYPQQAWQFDRLKLEGCTNAIDLVSCKDFVFNELQTVSTSSQVWKLDYSTVVVRGGTATEHPSLYYPSGNFTNGSILDVRDVGGAGVSTDPHDRYVGDSGTDVSQNAAWWLDNTYNVGTGLGIYSNQDSTTNAPLIHIKVNNSLFDNPAALIENNGTSYGLHLVNAGTGRGLDISQTSNGDIAFYAENAGGANHTSGTFAGVQMYNAGDTSTAFLIDNAGTGRTLSINHHDNGTNATIYAIHTGNSASPVTGLSMTVSNSGAGGTLAATFSGGPVDLGTQKLTSVATPTLGTDGANKAYVDAVAQGLSVKQSVQEATAAALPANTYSSGVITITATGVLTVDGITVALNDRVLVQNETTGANNGIYLCTTAGAGGVAAVLTRATDSNTGAEVLGAFVFVEKGTVNANSGFVNTNTSVPTVGTTAITYTQFSGAGEITAGSGLSKSGNTLSVATAGVTTAMLAATTGSGNVVLSTSPTLVTPALGTPSALVGTNITGTAAGLTAGNVTTNANLTGPITSVGNATAITPASVTNAMLAGSIAASKLVGTDIATVGTITSGSWNGTTVAVANGGTGVTTSTGTGSVVLSASPTFTGTATVATIDATTYKQSGNTIIVTSSTGNITRFGIGAGTAIPTTSAGNTAIGANALTATTGDGNVGVGYNTLVSNVGGGSNVAVGYESLHSNISGNQNFGLGREALYNSTNSDNIGIGFQALRTTGNAGKNIGIGTTAGYHNTTGSDNVIIGYSAGIGASDYANSGMVLIGREAGKNLTTGGDYNIFVGYQAGWSNSSGDTNTYLGKLAGQNITTGSSNLALGNNALLPTATASNQLNVANAIFATGLATSSSASVIPTLTGLLGVFISAPTASLDVAASTTAAASLRLRAGTAPTSPNNGDIWYDGTNLVGRTNSSTRKLDIDTSVDGTNLVLGTSTGTQLGTAANQKFAQWGATPVVQPVATTELIAALVSTGQRASGSVVPITTSGTVTLTGSNAYGTPASITLTNATGLPESGVTNLTTDLAAKLSLGGGTMSGAIAMGSNKITGLTNGSAASDAAAFGQIPLIDSTATDIVQTGSRIAGSTGKAADAGHVHPSTLWQPSDYSIISWAYDPSLAVNGSALATAGKLYVVKLHMPYAQNVTNILTYVTTAGSVLTSGQCFAALYQAGSLLGTTADQATAWAGTGLMTMAISGGAVAVAAGDVYVAFWFNGTVGPSLARGVSTNMGNLGLGATVSRYGTADTGRTTTAPGTLGAISALTLAYWAGLS